MEDLYLRRRTLRRSTMVKLHEPLSILTLSTG